MLACKALQKEAKPLSLQVSWAKSEAHIFRGLLDEAIGRAHVCVCKNQREGA